MRSSTCSVAAAAIALLAMTITAHAQVRGVPVPFDHLVIDPAHTGDVKELGDIDGDGFPDAVMGGGVALWWYHYPDWTATVVATPQVEQFTTDMRLADIDGDGDLDIVVPDGPNGLLLWYENPRPAGDPAHSAWTRHIIGTAGYYIHDVRVADLNGDGRLDVVTGDHIGHHAWIQGGSVSNPTWTKVTISTLPGTGLALGDIDGDGRPDVVLGTVWYKTPADPINGAWVERAIDLNLPPENAPEVIDIDGDGRADIVNAPSESQGSLSWYQAPADPLTGTWTRHEITSSIGFVHALAVVDINRDGALDIVFAEQAQSTTKRIGYFAGTAGGGAWTLNVIATTGSHNIRVGDIGNDGDLDILGSNWQGPPLEAWINRLDPHACAADWDRNGNVEPADVAAFVNDWSASLQDGTLAGDFDGDHAVTPADVAVFVNAWYAALTGGC